MAAGTKKGRGKSAKPSAKNPKLARSNTCAQTEGTHRVAMYNDDVLIGQGPRTRFPNARQAQAEAKRRNKDLSGARKWVAEKVERRTFA